MNEITQKIKAVKMFGNEQILMLIERRCQAKGQFEKRAGAKDEEIYDKSCSFHGELSRFIGCLSLKGEGFMGLSDRLAEGISFG
jgi:hypothetical protein